MSYSDHNINNVISEGNLVKQPRCVQNIFFNHVSYQLAYGLFLKFGKYLKIIK